MAHMASSTLIPCITPARVCPCYWLRHLFALDIIFCDRLGSGGESADYRLRSQLSPPNRSTWSNCRVEQLDTDVVHPGPQAGRGRYVRPPSTRAVLPVRSNPPVIDSRRFFEFPAQERPAELRWLGRLLAIDFKVIHTVCHRELRAMMMRYEAESRKSTQIQFGGRPGI